MQFYRGVNCHTFWDNLLFYVLFVRPTSVHVAGGSTISAAGVGLVPVVLPGYPTIHSLAPAYWTPTDRKNTNLLITTKLYSSQVTCDLTTLKILICRGPPMLLKPNFYTTEPVGSLWVGTHVGYSPPP